VSDSILKVFVSNSCDSHGFALPIVLFAYSHLNIITLPSSALYPLNLQAISSTLNPLNLRVHPMNSDSISHSKTLNYYQLYLKFQTKRFSMAPPCVSSVSMIDTQDKSNQFPCKSLPNTPDSATPPHACHHNHNSSN